MKEDYKKYGQTDYYWILEFLDSDYERSSYKKNGADIVLKMNNAGNIKELIVIRMEIHKFIEQNNIGKYLVNQDILNPLKANRMDKFINRCFNGNVKRLIKELPDNEESIDKALELYVNSYYIDPTTDSHITKVLRQKFGDSISSKLANLEGVKNKYWDCLNKYKNNISYPEGSNGSKRIFEEYKNLQKELERYGYVYHIYDIVDAPKAYMITAVIIVLILGAIFIAVGGFFGIGVIIFLLCLVFGQLTGRSK
ncbi:hypothetical protein CIK99_03420 [Prevotella sp. P5-92]|uniref:hypothetical protein n=1 Tax=Prevotella sp. P5-92 TaxID=2024222 RepID=UPI000B968359|nr:hypothetical protein [Prevotella sp. P5-92]OYP58698.1 hypothetical protein CIK99_03420 [Prevotella sp. P5-92]